MRALLLIVGLAWRYQTATHREVHGFLAKISTLGIAVGVAVSIIGLSAMNGFDTALQQRIVALVPHGEVAMETGKLTGWPSIAKRLMTTPGIVATAPYIESVALVEKGTTFKAIQLRGVAVEHEEAVTALPQQVVPSTAWHAFRLDAPQIILGSSMAAALAVQPGEWVTLILPANHSPRGWCQPKRLLLQVVGLLTAGSQLDQHLALVPLAALQGYLGMETQVSGIAVRVNQPFKATTILQHAAAYHSHSGMGKLRFKSWMTHYGHLYRDIQMVRGMINLAMLLVTAIACFNITTTLMITAKQRQGDIAILATLGASKRLLSWLFLCYGLLTGLIGSMIGVVIGILVASHLTVIMQWLERTLHYHFLPSQLYFIDYIPSEIHWQDSATIFTVTMLLCLLASWYPAYWSSRRDPVAILSQHSD